MTTIERLLEMNKPLADEQIVVRQHGANERAPLASGPMSFVPRESDGDFVFTVGGISFVADDVIEIDDDNQIVWIESPRLDNRGAK